MKNVLILPLLFFSLFAQEQAGPKKEEGGLIHMKQEGRYKVVPVLPEKAEDPDQAFDYAKPFAVFRLADILVEQDGLAAYGIDGSKSSGTAFGGIFGFDTAAVHGLQLHLGAYVSQKCCSPNDPQEQNTELFDAQGDGFVYMGEAGVRYENEMLQAKAGRIRIETPYADSDDIRMVPNSFEGAWGNLNIGEHWQIQAYALRRWAGVDSGDDPNKFKAFVDGGYGVSGGSLTYNIDDDNDLSLWYYNVAKESDIVYAEGAGHLYFSEQFHMEWGIQGMHIRELSGSGVAGDVAGGMLIADFDTIYVGSAYNHVFTQNNAIISDGFGGGPYYTSLDEQTIGAVSELAPGKDLKVFRIALGLDLTALGVNGLNLEFVHGHFLVEKSPAEVEESDVMLTYTITDRWYLESIYSNVNMINVDYTDPDNRELRDFRRLVTRLDYAF